MTSPARPAVFQSTLNRLVSSSYTAHVGAKLCAPEALTVGRHGRASSALASPSLMGRPATSVSWNTTLTLLPARGVDPGAGDSTRTTNCTSCASDPELPRVPASPLKVAVTEWRPACRPTVAGLVAVPPATATGPPSAVPPTANWAVPPTTGPLTVAANVTRAPSCEGDAELATVVEVEAFPISTGTALRYRSGCPSP